MLDKRTAEYTILAIILVSLIVALSLATSQIVKFGLILLLSSGYLLYGILHHYEEKNLNSRIVFEYFAVSFLIFIILYSFFVGTT